LTCFVCRKSIKGESRKEGNKIAHANCFLAKSIIKITKIGPDSISFLPGSGISKSKQNEIISDNILGEINEQ